MAHRWYAIQTYAGSEQAVKKGIINLVNDHGIAEKLEQIVVPTEDVIEVKNGKKKISERSLYPGYAFAKLDLDTALWHLIQSLPKVGRFIGESKKPTPLSEKDIALILEKAEKKGAPKPKIFLRTVKVLGLQKVLSQTSQVLLKSMIWFMANSHSMFQSLVEVPQLRFSILKLKK